MTDKRTSKIIVFGNPSFAPGTIRETGIRLSMYEKIIDSAIKSPRTAVFLVRDCIYLTLFCHF